MARTPEQKAKAALHAKEDRKKNPDRWREYDLKKSFGITLEYYKKLELEQKGVCAICGNQGIGNFRENPKFLIDAASYVIAHNGP